MPQINQRRLSAPSLHPFSRCIITKITIMKILSASQPPSPHVSLLLSCLSTLPPTACLTPAGGNSSKWNWGCNSLVLLKYICPLQTLCADVLVFCRHSDKEASEIIWSVLLAIFYLCDFNPKIQTLVDCWRLLLIDIVQVKPPNWPSFQISELN